MSDSMWSSVRLDVATGVGVNVEFDVGFDVDVYEDD